MASTRPARQRVVENERLTKALLEPVKRWEKQWVVKDRVRIFKWVQTTFVVEETPADEDLAAATLAATPTERRVEATGGGDAATADAAAPTKEEAGPAENMEESAALERSPVSEPAEDLAGAPVAPDLSAGTEAVDAPDLPSGTEAVDTAGNGAEAVDVAGNMEVGQA